MHRATYDRELVSGPERLPQDWLGHLGDFDWGTLTAYKPDYLLGREVELSSLDRSRPSITVANRSRRRKRMPAGRRCRATDIAIFASAPMFLS